MEVIKIGQTEKLGWVVLPSVHRIFKIQLFRI